MATTQTTSLGWEQLRYRLDENRPFNQMRGTPYYADAAYEQFSAAAIARRYAALRDRMRQLGLDCRTAQIGSPVCIGEPPVEVRRFFDEVALPGFVRMVDAIRPDRPLEDARAAGRFFREHGAQSRPIHLHGIDLVSSSPHVFTDHVDSEGSDDVLQPGMVLVVEPTPITADGRLGMFFGHTFQVTPEGRECLDEFPWQLTVVPA